jgi:hypothetical protein
MLALQYRGNWLSGIKTKIRLGIIPYTVILRLVKTVEAEKVTVEDI